jgi:hypothetical protein
MIAQGYFVIADITGYTAYMTQSGLEDAQGVLNHLFDGLLEAMPPPLQISNFQGDAVLAYVPVETPVQGQTFLELLENIYVAFMALLDETHRNACCDCDACENMPDLDLKLFVHYGQYAVQKLRGRQELSGPDVILVHRLMKNDVRERTGLKSYALLTEAAVEAMQLGDVRGEMRPYTTTYEHLGEVRAYVHDLHAVYARAREARRVFVAPEEAWLAFEAELPVPPAVAWDYLTRTDHNRIWLQMDSVARADESGGRIQPGTRFHCARSTDDLDYAIVDWRPFDYFTVDGVGLGGLRYSATYRLAPTEHGSRLGWYWRHAPDEAVAEWTPAYERACREGLEKLQAMIAANA